MKNFEKIVPVLASGLVVAGLGTADAFAAPETPNETLPPPGETQQSETGNQSTEIKNVTPANTEQTETGVTTTEGVVNLDVDSNGDLKSDGNLTVTTTPSETDPKTDTTTTTTNNPNGSTTTTTTTTTTENSSTTVEGNVTTDRTDASEEETAEADKKVNEDLNNSKKEDGSYDWTAIEQKYGKVTHSEDGITHTFTFSQDSATNDKPLNQAELSEVLGKELTAVGDDGKTFRYTEGNTTVTFTVTDASTETTTTTWTVTVTEGTKTEDGKVDINTPVVDIEDTQTSGVDAPSVKEILDKVKDPIDVNKGVTFTEGSKLYTLTFKKGETKTVDVSDPNVLIGLLPSNDGYELKDGKIIQTTENGDVRELTFDSETQTLTVTEYTISMTVKDAHGNQATQNNSNEAEATEKAKKAISDAVTAAMTADLNSGSFTSDELKVALADETNLKTVDKGNGVWVTTIKIGGKDYTYTVKATIDKQTGNLNIEHVLKEHEGNVVDGSGSTTTITGNAYVSGETVVWSGTHDSTTSFIKVDNGKGTVSAKENDVIDTVTGEKVTAVTKDNNGKITGMTTSFTSTDKDGNEVVTTKVYTFQYGVALDATDKSTVDQILAAQGAEGATLEGLSKITWTIQQTDKTTVAGTEPTDTPDDSNNGITVSTTISNLPDGVVKNQNGSYTYDGVTLNKGSDGKYHGHKEIKNDEGKVINTIEYTIIEESDVPLTDASKIQDLIAKQNIVPTGYTFQKIDGGKAIYKNSDGIIMAIEFNAAMTNVTLTTKQNHVFADTSREEMLNDVRAWIEEQRKLGTITIGDFEIDKNTTEEKIGEIITWIDSQAINHDVDFTEMSKQDLIDLLLKMEQQSNENPANNGGYIVSPKKEDGTSNTYDAWVSTGVKKGTKKTFNGVTYTCIGSDQWQEGTATWTEGYWDWVYWHDGSWSDNALSGPVYKANEQGYINIPIPETNGDKDYNESGFHTELGHVDLVADSTLSKTEGSIVSSEDCVILGTGLEVWLNATASGLINNQGSQKAPLSGSIDWDDQDGLEGKGFWQYDRSSNVSQDYLDRTNKFYKVTGTVAYGLTHYDKERDAKKAISQNGVIDYVKVPKVDEKGNVVKKDGKVVYEYVTYTKTAVLTTYGYLGPENNACHNDYDIKLGNLTLLEGHEKVTSINESVTVFSTSVSATSSVTSSKQNLTFGNIVTTTPGTPDKVITNTDDTGKGQQIAGNWTITQEKRVEGTNPNSDKLEEKWAYTGTGTGSYDSYQTYVTTEQTGTATGTQYGGSLSYTYKVPGTPEVTVEGTTQTNRVVDVTLDNTSVTVTPGTPVTTPGDNGGGGGDDNRTPTTPTPPVDIPEEDPPLVDIPEEEPPLVDVPEEEPPLVDVPEEEPPLVDIPDTETPTVTIPAQKVPLVKAPTPNTVEILEEDVPLAEVPETGESPMDLLAAAAACFSALGLGLLKKKSED